MTTPSIPPEGIPIVTTATGRPYPRQKPAQGWECPRCHRIHAPTVAECSCAPTASEASHV